jgi:hypothetical protein
MPTNNIHRNTVCEAHNMVTCPTLLDNDRMTSGFDCGQSMRDIQFDPMGVKLAVYLLRIASCSGPIGYHYTRSLQERRV